MYFHLYNVSRTPVQVKSHAQAVYGRCDRRSTSKHHRLNRKNSNHAPNAYTTRECSNQEYDNCDDHHHYNSTSNDTNNDDDNDKHHMDNDEYSIDIDIDHQDDTITLAARNLLHVAHSKVQNLNDLDNYWNVTNTPSSPPWKRIQDTVVSTDIPASGLIVEGDETTATESKMEDVQHGQKFSCNSSPLRIAACKEHVLLDNTNTPKSDVKHVFFTPPARVTPTEEYHHEIQLQVQSSADNNDTEDLNTVPQFYHGHFHSTQVSPMKRVYKCRSSFPVTNNNENDDRDFLSFPRIVRPKHQRNIPLSSIGLPDQSSPLPSNHEMMPFSPIKLENKSTILHPASCFKGKLQKSTSKHSKTTNSQYEKTMEENTLFSSDNDVDYHERSAAVILQNMASFILSSLQISSNSSHDILE